MLEISGHLKEVVERQIKERSGRAGRSDRALTTVKGTALGDLQFRAQVEGHSFIADERKSAGGRDAGPAPMRYFLAGMMLCHKVWMVKTTALHGFVLDSLEGEISWYNDVPVPRIVYTIAIDGPTLSAENVEAIVEGGARGCAAFKTMERAVRIEVTAKLNGKVVMDKTYGLA